MSDPDRRRVALRFRAHIREATIAESALTDSAGAPDDDPGNPVEFQMPR